MPAIVDFLKPRSLNQTLISDQRMPIYGQEESPNLDPRTLSTRIQEWLGAREPDQGGTTQDILTKRLDPSWEDVGQSVLSSFQNKKFVPAQAYADQRMKDNIERMQDLAKTEYYSQGGSKGNSVFSQTLEAINNDPELADLPMIQKIRMAQNKLGTNLTVGPDGQVVEMAGSPGSLGRLKYGETMGKQQAEIDTASSIAEQSAIGKASGEARGGLAKREVNAPAIMNLALEAEKLLPKSTSGALALGSRGVSQFFGQSTEASKADRRLGVIAAALTSNVPRMEGPQSDYDVALYQQAAGDIANPKLPYEDRIAALQTIKDLQQKYMKQSQNLPMSPNDFSQIGLGDVEDALSPQGAKQASDGNFYIPDPNRPGKYLKVE